MFPNLIINHQLSISITNIHPGANVSLTLQRIICKLYHGANIRYPTVICNLPNPISIILQLYYGNITFAESGLCD